MGILYAELTDDLVDFIQRQKLFFVGTATDDGRGNVSPKGLDTLCVVTEDRIVWLNPTGSGNETAARLREIPTRQYWQDRNRTNLYGSPTGAVG